MGIGLASGENRGVEAAKNAISSPLLETSIEGATGILLNISGGPDMGLFEVNEAAEIIAGAADADANVIFGAVIDDSLGDQMRVTVIATGFDQLRKPATISVADKPSLFAPKPVVPKPETTQPKKPDLLPQTVEAFEMDEEVLDIPKFLREKE
jgi:cell division protein FtsZ